MFHDPFEEMRRMQKDIDHLFGLTEDKPSRASTNNQQLARPNEAPMLWRPLVDVKENDKDIVIHAELPGVTKDHIAIDLDNNVLTISGERKHEKREDNDKYHRVERSYGKFSRSFMVPEGLKEDHIRAKFDNGVLEVTYPKMHAARKDIKKITIG